MYTKGKKLIFKEKVSEGQYRDLATSKDIDNIYLDSIVMVDGTCYVVEGLIVQKSQVKVTVLKVGSVIRIDTTANTGTETDNAEVEGA